MAIDQDAIWRPDYTGPAPVREEPTTIRSSPRSAGSDRRSGTAAHGTADRAGRAAWDATGNATVAGSGPTGDATGPAAPTGGGRRRWKVAVVVAGVGLFAVAVFVVGGDRDDGSAAERGASTVAAEIRRVGEEASSSGLDPSTLSESTTGAELVVPLGGLPDDGEPFDGADPRRLPASVLPLWTAELAPGSGEGDDPAERFDASVLAIDDRFVAVLSGAGGSSPVAASRLDLFAVGSGAVVWRADMPARASAFGLVGVVDDVLLVESSLADRRLAGFDLVTGDERWVYAEAPGQFDVIGEAAGFDLLAGSPLVARRPVVDTDPTLVFDAATGERVGQLEGEVIGYDGVGAWHTFLNGSIKTHDLSEGYSSGRPLGTIWQPQGRGDVVDDRIVQPDRGRIFITEADSRTGITIAVIDSETNGVDVPSSGLTVSAMAGSTMLIAGGGEVVGAELTGNVIRPAWRRTGVVQSVFATERGHVFLLATRGGAQFEVVDGRTGGTLHALALRPGALGSLAVAGNGLVVQRVSEVGPRIAALDLDGEELWSLPGSTPVSVGDGVVARTEDGPNGPVLAVYG